jgi:hypothetical protein
MTTVEPVISRVTLSAERARRREKKFWEAYNKTTEDQPIQRLAVACDYLRSAASIADPHQVKLVLPSTIAGIVHAAQTLLEPRHR